MSLGTQVLFVSRTPPADDTLSRSKSATRSRLGLHHLSTSHRQTERVQDMLAFINFALPDFGEAKAIEQDEIWLFSPARGHTKRWNLIGEEDWEVATYPGMRLGMSMNDVTNRCEELSSAATDGATSGAPILALGNKAPWRVETPRILAGATLASASDDVGPALHRSNHCAGSSSPSSAVPEAPVVVQFSTPLPEWSTYPEDAEFRFL